MANFSEVVDELKENNQQTATLVNLQQQEVAVETAAGGAASASAKETEKNREGERSQNKILASLQSISGGIMGMAGNFGEMLKDKGKEVGGDIFGMLKKFAFGAAVAGVLVFLKSKYWEDTKKFIVEDMIPALKNLWENVLSPILSVFKDVFVKQWENVKGLFDDLGTAIDQFASGDILGGITTLIGGLGEFFFKTVDNVLTGIFNLVAGLFGFEGTDSIGMSMFSFILDTWETITGAFDDVVEWFGSAFTWAKEGLLGAWTSLTDFVSEKWNATKDFFTESYTWAKEGIAGTWTTLSDFVSSKFKVVTEWFSTVFTDPKAALEQLWTGLVGDGGLINFLFKPIDDAIAWIQGVFSWGNPEEPFKLSTVVSDGFKAAKEWVVGLFTFSDEDATVAGIATKLIDIVLAPYNLAVNFLRGVFGFGADEQGNVEPFSLGTMIVGVVTDIINFFKGLFDIDIKGLINSIPGADKVLSWFGFGDEEPPAESPSSRQNALDRERIEQNRDEVALVGMEMEEISQRMDRFESGKNAYIGRDTQEKYEADRAKFNELMSRESELERENIALQNALAERQGTGNPSIGTGSGVRSSVLIPTSNGLIAPDVSGANARTNMVQSGSVSNIANSVSGGTTIINAPQSNTNISGGSGGGGRIIPMNVTDNDPTFRAIAANSF
jgi:hypothetical protein